MPADKAPTRTTTQAGLGAVTGSGEHEADASKKTVRLPADSAPESTPPSSRARMTLPVRMEAEPRALISEVPQKKATSSAPPSSGGEKKRSREPRQAIAVDDVGGAVLEAHSRPPRHAKPKVTKSRRELASAPLDPREAFLISFVDGKLSVASLVDVSGMGEGEVMTILARLRRLGIVTYG